jgi:O-antigen biosynthesis protein
MELSIIIVNWNVKEYLLRCLNSIFETTKNIKFEVIVFDNASNDGSQKMLKEKFPQVKIIESNVNLGFPRANNLAVCQSRGEYILFLNPDTIVYENSISLMLNYLKQNSDCGIVGPKILDKNGDIDYTCAKNFPTPFSTIAGILHLDKFFPKSKIFGHYLMSWWDHTDSRKVPAVSGACFMISRKLFDELGGFDTEIEMYFEDIDLFRRVYDKGKYVYYLAEATITHFQGASSRKEKNRERFYILTWKALEKFFERYYSKFYVYLYRLGLVIGGIINLIIGIPGFWLFMKKSQIGYLQFIKKYWKMCIYGIKKNV